MTRNDVSAALTAPSNGAELQRVTSVAADAGERLDRVLATHLADLSRSRLKHLILEGSVTQAGATISDPAIRVKPRQTFVIAIPAPTADRPPASRWRWAAPAAGRRSPTTACCASSTASPPRSNAASPPDARTRSASI